MLSIFLRSWAALKLLCCCILLRHTTSVLLRLHVLEADIHGGSPGQHLTRGGSGDGVGGGVLRVSRGG